MSNAVVGALRVTLGLDSAAFTEGLSAAQAHLRGVGRQMQDVGRRISGVGRGLTVGITAPITAAAAAFGAATNQIAQNISEMAAEAETAGVSFEQFQQLRYVAEQNLISVEALTDGLKEMQLRADEFVSTGAGSGAEAFARLGLSAADLAEGLRQPEALFEDIIDRLSELDTAAQIRIADEIFGGTGGEQFVRLMNGGAEGIRQLKEEFVAMGGVVSADQAGDMREYQLAMQDIGRAVQQVVVAIAGSGLIQTVSGLAQQFAGWIRGLSEINPELVKWGAILAGVAAAVGPVLVAVGSLVTVMGAVLPALGTVAAALAALPLAPVIAGVAALTIGFLAFKDDIVPAIQTFGRAVAEELGPKLQPLLQAVMGAVQALGGVFSAIFGGSGSSTADLTSFGEVVGRIFSAALDIITGAINVVTNVLRALGALLRGDFSAMWGFLGQAVASAVIGIGRAFQTLFPEVSAWVRQTFQAVREWLLGRFEAVVQGIGRAVGRVAGFFRDLYVAVVGNSYVPDMVTAIAHWMGPQLQSAMVDPARQAADETAGVFSDLSSTIEGQLEGLLQSIGNKDWKGALGGIFDILGGQGGKLGAFGKIGSAIFGALPGFQTGGSFTVAGSGAADSQLVAFRASPGERVDISTRSQQRDHGGGVAVIRIDKSPYFDAEVERVSAPVANAAAGAMAGQIGAHQADAHRRAIYRTRGGR